MSLNVAVLGATGAVGAEFLQLFDRRDFPLGELRLLASPRSEGTRLRGHRVEAVTPDSFRGVDVAFFSAGASRSREYWPHAQAADTVVIDNSSAFRMDPQVPLVVPEINFDDVKPETQLIANPNCTAAILLMATRPLMDLGRVTRIILSTYQSASGAGAQAMAELETSTRAVLNGESFTPSALPHPYAFNLFSHNTAIGPDGANEEERKVAEECRKVLGRPDLGFNVTCVRVPVLRAHSLSVTLEFDGPAPTLSLARDAIDAFPGSKLVDDRGANHFPMPIEASGAEDVLVGRLRHDPSNPNALCLFACGDQLLKGAALNAVQIAECMIKAGYLKTRARS